MNATQNPNVGVSGGDADGSDVKTESIGDRIARNYAAVTGNKMLEKK